MAFRTLKPNKKAKIDLKQNGKAVTKVETGKLPLHIDRHTVIFVDPQNCNTQYAAEYRKKVYITKQTENNEL